MTLRIFERRQQGFVSAIKLLGLLSLCLIYSTVLAAKADAPEANIGQSLSYKVSWRGIENKTLLALIQSASRLVAFRSEPPSFLPVLERRIEADLKRFRTILRSEGYYSSRITYQLDARKLPVSVVIEIEPGAAYSLKTFDVVYAAQKPKRAPDLEPPLGRPARTPAILRASDRVIQHLAETGYPFAEISDRQIIVDHDSQSVAVALTVDAGPLVRFGPMNFVGLRTIEEQYLDRLKTWKDGQVFNQHLMEDYRRVLSGLGLFDSVRVELDEVANGLQERSIIVTVAEAKRRSAGFGLQYSSSEGIGGNIFWENRNFLGRGEVLGFDIGATEIQQQFGVRYVKPHFRRINQKFQSNFVIRRQTTDAFDERAVATSISLDRPVGNRWSLSSGVLSELTEIRENGFKDTFVILGLPLSIRRDASNDPLDPTKGTRLFGRVIPYVSIHENSDMFVLGELSSAAYTSPLGKRLTLAIRARLASIIGAATDAIPASKRLYAGGGGSIRGYEFQKVGPLDATNDPTGGRSVFEVGAEIRWRITSKIGLAPFIDGGNVFDKNYPDLSKKLQWAAGIGALYKTPIGPIRFDLAFPLNRRVGVDNGFEFYVNLGQAF